MNKKIAPWNEYRAVTIMTELVMTFTDLRRAGFSDEEILRCVGDVSIPLDQAGRHIEAGVQPTRKSVKYTYTTRYSQIKSEQIRKLGTKIK